MDYCENLVRSCKHLNCPTHDMLQRKIKQPLKKMRDAFTYFNPHIFRSSYGLVQKSDTEDQIRSRMDAQQRQVDTMQWVERGICTAREKLQK